MTEIFHPAGRLSAEASRVIVDWILGGGLFLIALGAWLFAFQAWSRARRLTAEVWHRHGLRAGPILLTGDAHRRDDDPPSDRGFIELTITQTGREHRNKNGPYVAWTELSRGLVERPFLLKTDGGDTVEVVPGGRVELVDRLEPAIAIGPSARKRTARVTEGERLWMRGELRREGGQPSGPYRGGGEARWTLRPPARGALFVSSEPVEAEDLVATRRHLRMGLAVFVALLFIQGVVFASFQSLRAHAVETQGTIVQARHWRVHTKNGYSNHYAWAVRYETTLGPTLVEDEVNSVAWSAHAATSEVPVTYDARHPSTMQVGTADQVGASFGAALAACLVAFFLLSFYGALVGQRPWWRQRRVVDRVAGPL